MTKTEGSLNVTYKCGHERTVQYGTIDDPAATERSIRERATREVCYTCRLAAQRYKLGKVEIDNIIPPTPAYFVENDSWNGWAIPFFTREQADAVMALWNKNATDEEGKMWFDEQRDAYCVAFVDREEMNAYEGESLEIAGEVIHGYAIGAYDLTWQDAREPDEHVKEIAAAAAEAFWDKVVELVPEAVAGDFSPDDTARFRQACESAVKLWVHYNVPGAEDKAL